MNEKDVATGDVDVIDAQTEFTLAELCRSCNVQAEFIEALVEEGILEPSGKRHRHWCFHASSLRRTRVTLHLQHDLGVNLAGAALALDLLERIEELEARLHAVGAERYEK
ncbi:MAG: chaperone modulator CbpM [Acidiferrobacterales bacterium]|jgi:chaperone modulatory protein CbpM|nr:chaperone modulator CbpM [Acidiferrobacterales bacterium]